MASSSVPPRFPAHGGATHDDVPLTVAAVAARLGVAASTLRTWDRRYGLGPSSHEAGAHRRYSAADVARLERMRELTLRGVAPADAARAAIDGAAAAPGDAAPARPADEGEPLLVDPLSLAAAALEPDQPRVRRMLEQEARGKGIVRMWTELVVPALAMLDKRERTDRPGADPEGVLQAGVLGAVHNAAGAGGPTRDGTVIVTAGRDLRLRGHVIAGGLAERGVHARVLRGETIESGRELLEVVRDRRARVLAMLGRPDGAEQLVREVAAADEVEIFLLGSDPPDVWLPRVRRVRAASAAVEEISGILGA